MILIFFCNKQLSNLSVPFLKFIFIYFFTYSCYFIYINTCYYHPIINESVKTEPISINHLSYLLVTSFFLQLHKWNVESVKLKIDTFPSHLRLTLNTFHAKIPVACVDFAFQKTETPLLGTVICGQFTSRCS